MSSNKAYLNILLKKFEAGECNDEELKLIDEWYDSLNETEQNQMEINEVFKMGIKNEMWQSILPKLTKTKANKSTQPNIRLYFKSIAALFLLGICIFWFMYYSGYNHKRGYTTILVSKGETKKIILPDGTAIWLNSDSKIKYPDEFKNGRIVYLEGEAFFSVTHDSSHPFTVYTTSGIAVEDLGTEFNLKSYSSLDMIKVSVLKGKVAIKDSAKMLTELSRNEGAVIGRKFKNLDKINIGNSKPEGWINGEIVLNNVSFDELALAIDNSFRVTLKYNYENLRGCRSSISFKTTDKLKDIMDDLALIYKFQYAIEKDQVHISGKSCN